MWKSKGPHAAIASPTVSLAMCRREAAAEDVFCRKALKIKPVSNISTRPEGQRPPRVSGDNEVSVIDNVYHVPERRHTDQWLPEYDTIHGYITERTANQRSHPESTTNTLLTASKNDELLQNIHHELTYFSLIQRVSATNDASSPHCTLESVTIPSTSSETACDRLPEFVNPLSSQLTLDDINYISRKGALDIPRTEFLDALIRAYVRYFHWFMPLLDQKALLNCAGGHWRPGMPRIGILLLQAVIFIGLTFVDIQGIHEAGFESRRVARKVLYERVRLLYELDVEESRVAIIQATLLMSFWNETPGDNKGGWHFLGIAISLALTLGLHQKQTFSRPSMQKHLLKRIWWSCYIRDRMLALGMSRPLRIKDIDFNTPILTLDDFDLEDSSTGDPQNEILELQCQQNLAEMCITMAQLCVEIGVVIDLHYSILPSDDFDHSTEDLTGRTTTILYPKSQPEKQELVEICDQSLQRWFNNRPISAIFQPLYSKGMAESAAVIMTHQAFLHVFFCGTLSALHRPQVDLRKSDARNVNQSEQVREQSRLRVEEATTEMAKINFYIHRFRLGSFLPPTAATLELPVIITHLKHIQYQEGQHLETCLKSIFYCLKVVEQMQELYVGVDLVVRFAADLMRRANITVITAQDTRIIGVSYRECQYQLDGTASGEPDANLEIFLSKQCPVRTLSHLSISQSSRDSSTWPRTTPSNGQADDTGDDLPKAHWNCWDDVFLTESLDLEAIFQLMVDFDSLNELALV
ncbi:uncharacterized protein Z519_12397 [Cladophialophora bantiana CBS 173.52]|uniref:Xylanolytic transcriptional activator regulatory domain-containing protein n=1 Tax=Cladophialophora bantiana (strain ATCC 10958 / CBS 173.52 / CDC B-1940 / NIH 8579) TaxID=1442370 RepID=A0A0D2FJQ8_CLAB1|nr:uncharacterized protein Z519_12397 [Cladophialophora bantiana CBS 173.52]KIW86932.1 hypothetical protein Z519_12397 [Cladophialophora bantiana CBS 173.52]